MTGDHKHSIEEVLGQFTQEQEAQQEMTVSPKSPAAKVKQTTMQDDFAENARKQVAERVSLQEAHEIRRAEIKSETLSRGQGFMEIPMADLPSGGIFYPDGTRIMVRAASGGDIRHWSMTNENSLSDIDDALNYIIERCVQITFPSESGIGTWKDLKEIDRFYLILCIRDFTFTEGHNELKISVSENQEVVVKKDNISFIDLGDKIMKFYNPQLRCFQFKAKTPSVDYINIYFPSVGVTQWLKSYVERKTQRQESFDKDFLTIAPMLIKDYRLLNDKNYGELIFSSMSWGVYEWSLISKVKQIIERSVTPKMTYIDEEGAEQETPLNFQGGIKSIFTLNLDEELDL